MDRVSATGFASAADAYAAARPGWPLAAVDTAFDHWGIDPRQGRAVDLAAGTGLLTRQLAQRCPDLVAVEPVEAMRAHITSTPDTRDGTAEDLPLRSGEAAAVFVAEAFHWFDHPTAVPELARALQPRGGLAVLWHHLLGDQPWHADVGALIEPHHYHPRGLKLSNGAPSDDDTWQHGPHWDGWDPIVRRTVEHTERVTREKTVTRIASFSYIGALDAATRADVLKEVDAVLAHHGVDEYEERWRCDLYLTRSPAYLKTAR